MTTLKRLWDETADSREQLWANANAPMWQAALDETNVTAGTRFLDAGCGSGGASRMAALRGAIVSGLDISDEMVRITSSKVPDGDFRVGDLVALPFDDGVFDAAIACSCVPYVSDPLRAVQELRRVCAPGGRVAVTTYGLREFHGSADPDGLNGFEILRSMLRLKKEPPVPDPFCLSDFDTLPDVMERAQLRVIKERFYVDLVAAYASVDAAWQGVRTVTGMQVVRREVPEETLRAEFGRVVNDHVDPANGSLRIVMRILGSLGERVD